MQKFPADGEAWDEFVRRYHPMIHAWCVKWGLQVSDADDVAQDVLVKLLAAMRNFQYDPSRSFSGWLKTVTQQHLERLLDRPAQGARPDRIRRSRSPTWSTPATNSSTSWRASSIATSSRWRCDGSRNASSPSPGTAFRLTALEGLSGQDAGERLEMPVAHVFVAKNRVQKLLQEEIRFMKRA